MLRYLFFICSALVALSGTARSLEGMRPKLACFPLVAKSIDAMAYNENVSTQLVNAIARSGAVELIERKKMEGVIEQRGVRLDMLDQAGLRELGAQAGFDFILTGVVGRSDGKLFLDLNLIGTHSQKVNRSWSYRVGDGEISSKLEEIALTLVPIMGEAQNVEMVAPVRSIPVLSPPTDLQGTGTSRSVRLKWSQSGAENVSGYKIYRSTAADGVYSQLANSSLPSYSDDNLELNDRFFYKVKGVGREGGESGFSLPVAGNTIVVPQPPVFMAVEAGVRSAQLSWYLRPVTGGDPMLVPVTCRLYRATSDTTDFQKVAEVAAGSNAYADGPLSEGSRYRYYLTSVNAAGGESEQSALLEITTVGGIGELGAVSGKIRVIPLSWKEHPFASIVGYQIFRGMAKEGPFERVGRTNAREATSYLDAVEADGALRWYRITGINKDGSETLPCEPVFATTRPIPAAPATPRVTSGEPRRVKVSWLLPDTPEDAKGGFSVYRSDDEKVSFKKIAAVAGGGAGYEDSSPPLGDHASYWYRVAAVNTVGAEGVPSPAAHGVTKATPGAPKLLSATTGEVRKVSLAWQKSTEGDLREYRVWLKKENGMYTLVASTKETSHVETGLKDGTPYTFAVTAVDADELESAICTPVAATTAFAPSRVTGVALEPRKGGGALSWSRNPEGNIRVYYIYKKGFLGAQKLGETGETSYLYAGDPAQLFVSAVNQDGLEGEPSQPVALEKQ